MSETASTAKSEPFSILKGRERRVHIFDAGLAVDGAPGMIACRVPTVDEEISARVAAATFRKANLGADVEVDESLDTDLETLNVLSTAFRRAEDINTPAFGPPMWMAKDLKREDVARLLNLLDEARARESKQAGEVDEDELADLAFVLADCSPEDAAEVLANMSRRDLIARLCTGLRWWVELLPVAMAAGAVELSEAAE